MDILSASGLTKRYGRRTGVEGLDLSLREGSVCGFLGPNGVGKSTTIRLLLGFLRPTAGRAAILGMDCWRDSGRIKQEVGYLPGDLRLYPWLTLRSALKLWGRIRRRDLGTAGAELAEAFDLEPDVRVSSMSRGMRQKLGLILALAHEPRLLILDEPTSSLDPVVQETLKLRLQERARRGHTVFFSSHTVAEVERLCERVVILRAGRLVADASLADLRARARREVTLRWKAGTRSPANEPPAGLEVLERSDVLWRCALDGPVEGLLRWLAAQPVDDVIIGQPDMETLFQRYYQE